MSSIKKRLKAPLRPLRRLLDHVALPAEARRERRRDLKGLLYDDPGANSVIEYNMRWLAVAQDRSASSDGGVARHYSPVSGWASSYPETTGYIVPTFLNWYERTGDVEWRDRAIRMLDWLVEIQFADGGFQGGLIDAEPRVPVTFNTGQILLGLAAGASILGERYDANMRRAADWLRDSQDADGAWRKHPTPFALPGEKAYETHVAWGLLEAARVDGGCGWGEAGMRNIDWALTKQTENGWYEDCCLNESDAPLTHTLGYVTRGVLEGWRYSGDRRYLDSASKTLESVRNRVQSDGRLAGRFDSGWNPHVPWVCVTGSSQLAECFIMAGEGGRNEQFIDTGRRLNGFVRRTIKIDGAEDTCGAVKGAYPADGNYGRYEYLNWAAKFTVDANLREIDFRA